tara:strand:+ start:1082 stop:1423 length:342 start_codon:yes stop_codon:yes gene_type:complete
MGEVIDLTKYLSKKEDEELEELSERLANLIKDMGITQEYEMYMSDIDDHVYGMPFIYTMIPNEYTTQKVDTLSDITDVLTSLTIKLDGMGHSKWANQISSIVGDIFVSGTMKC